MHCRQGEVIKMDYKVIREEQTFLDERETWTHLLKNMNEKTPFQTWEWNYIWWKSNESIDSLYIIKAFEGKETYGYAPFVIKNYTIEFIGGRDMDYGGFVVCKKKIKVIEGFLEHVLQQGYALALQELPSRSTQLHVSQKLLESKKFYLTHKTTRTIYVNLEKYTGIEDYLQSLSASMRNKTIKVGLKQGFEINIERITENLLQEIKEIYTDRQDVRGGSPDITWAFPVMQQMEQEKLLDVYMARKGSEAVAFLVAMNYCNTRYVWLTAFKQAYQSQFPGQMLFYRVLEDGFAEGNPYVDFMRGDYDFKMRWDCSVDTNYTIYIFRNYIPYLRKKLVSWIRPKLKKIVYSNESWKRIYKKYAK